LVEPEVRQEDADDLEFEPDADQKIPEPADDDFLSQLSKEV